MYRACSWRDCTPKPGRTALTWLKKAFEEREPFMVSLNVDPFWNSLRSEPRFQDLERRMNFPP
jgi:hypothetical protein